MLKWDPSNILSDIRWRVVLYRSVWIFSTTSDICNYNDRESIGILIARNFDKSKEQVYKLTIREQRDRVGDIS